MDAQLSVRREVEAGGPVTSVLRLAHTALDGTVESFVNIYDNISERLFKRQDSFPEPLDGMVAIVTGGNAGIGFATAQQLARRGAHVVLACRDKGRAEAAVQAIARTAPLPGCCGLSLPTTTASTVASTNSNSSSCSLGPMAFIGNGGPTLTAFRTSPSSPPRDPAAAAAAAALPPPGPPLRVECMELDLGRLSSVRSFAEEWRRRGLKLDLLVCNAGVMGPPQRLETADGLEMQFQVNFLSHWLLANELLAIERERRGGGGGVGRDAAVPGTAKAALPRGSAVAAVAASERRGKALLGSNNSSEDRRWAAAAAARTQIASGGGAAGAAAAGSRDGSTRVVMVTSLTHRAGPLQWLDKQSRKSYEPFLSYGLSKLANIMTAKEFQRRFDSSPEYGQDTAVAVHPGLVSTDLANGFFSHRSTDWAASTPLQPLVAAAAGGFSRLVGPLLMRTPDQSAAVMLHACLAPSSSVAGSYLALGRTAQPDQAAADPSMAADLWRYAERLTDCTPHPSLRREGATRHGGEAAIIGSAADGTIHE